MTHSLEWQFGGWLRALPPWIAWSALGAVALAGLLAIIWLYRRTLRDLAPAARLSLTVLRAAILATVLLCLANPARVERSREEASSHEALAVVVDRSASMSSADFRGTTRLAGAARLWKLHESEAQETFAKITHQRFAVGLQSAANLEEALTANEPGPETHLYAALRQTLAGHPGAIVCLTDGLDTTEDQSDQLIQDAQQRGVRLYFVVGKNRARARERLSIREIQAPPSVLRQTQFTASVLLEVAATQAREFPIELWSGATKLAAARLPLRAGLNTLPWSVPVTATEAGAMPLEFRAGEGTQKQTAACTTQVVEHTTLEVLYYQGALQWGYRFLRSALESDPSFRLTAILNPALNIKMNVATTGVKMLSDLPEDARELQRYQIIVLAHVFADQLTPPQQTALTEYVRRGGGVLFIAPDTNAARRFAGTPLEQMLPVFFEGAGPETEEDAVQHFRDQMAAQSGGGRNFSEEGEIHGHPLKLRAFAPAPGASRSATAALFQNGDAASLPRFSNFAKVRGSKPGASVLAVTSLDSGESAPRILLARQQFGDGFAVALTTDLLWRWKMSLPSGSHAVEKFWQQLLLSLAPPGGRGLRLVKLTDAPALNVPVEFRLDGAEANSPPAVEVVAPTGERTRLVVQKASGDENAELKTHFAPASTGLWEIRATDAAQNLARLTFLVSATTHTTENLSLPPDVDGLRRIAASTGGALIEDEPVFQKRVPPADEAKIQHVAPLWNSSWLLALLLGLYGSELVVRRCFKLL